MSSMLTRLRSRVTGAATTPGATATSAEAAATPEQRAVLLRAATPLPDPPGDGATFLTDACLHRYLRARNQDVDKASKMLSATLAWRSSYRPADLAAQRLPSLRSEAASGKMFVLAPADASGRACIVMRTGLENSRDAQGKIAYLVYTLERAARTAAAAGGEQFVVIVDYTVGEISASTLPGLSVMRETTNILQGHYPERLACMVMVQAPVLFHTLFKLIRPLVDSHTREKIHFVNETKDVVSVPGMDPNALPTEYGGKLDWSFNVDSYFEGEGVTQHAAPAEE